MTDPQLAIERAILGLVIDHPSKAAEAFARVRVEDFTGPNAAVAQAIHGLRVNRKTIDPTTVLAELQRRGTLARIGGASYLIQLKQAYVVVESLPAYLDEMTRTVRLRRLYEIGARLAQRSQEDDADVVTLARTVTEAAQAVIDGVEGEGDVYVPTLREFLAVEDEPYDWVIPGLLERGDRLMLTGGEGLGKSTLMRQIAICTAAGIHPFTHRPIPPQRVLVLDFENNAQQIRRALTSLATAARLRNGGSGADDNLHIEAIPAGIDVTRPDDEAWLIRRVAAVQPALFLTGSLYRLYGGDPSKEEPARHVARVLDRCRSVANTALILEAHAGHTTHGIGGDRNLRPIGASLWLRWPEFGYGIRLSKDAREGERIVDVVPWRGDRDARDWPKSIAGGGDWPWRAITPDTWTPSSALGGDAA